MLGCNILLYLEWAKWFWLLLWTFENNECICLWWAFFLLYNSLIRWLMWINKLTIQVLLKALFFFFAIIHQQFCKNIIKIQCGNEMNFSKGRYEAFKCKLPIFFFAFHPICFYLLQLTLMTHRCMCSCFSENIMQKTVLILFRLFFTIVSDSLA